MRDLETLKKLLRSVTNCDTVLQMTGKPFMPNCFDVIMSHYSPEFYNEEQLLQISNYSKPHASVDPTPMTENIKDKKVTKKRKTEEAPQDNVPSEPKTSRKKSKTNKKSIPECPEKFKNRIIEMNGCEVKFVMHKTLFSSDTKPNSNRLSMPTNEITGDFLTEDEIATLNGRDDCTAGKGRPNGIEVTVLDPSLREFTLPLKKWQMKRTETYNLIKYWNHIVSANEFEKDQELQIWSFRVENKLHIILHRP